MNLLRGGVLLVLALTFIAAHGIELHVNGGYDFILAIKNDVPAPEPKDIPIFFQKLKGGLESFSSLLWKTTHKQFHVRKVEIIVPKTWNLKETEYDETATSADTVASSDVRLARENTLPTVDNINTCGLPGKSIELPVNFFAQRASIGGDYGNPAKALLNQWARYRYGVWEEHGYPGHSTLPYFYLGKVPNAWLPNSCSNVPLSGKYSKTTSGEDEVCDHKTNNRPDVACRFLPDHRNEAQTSLMGFHWLESITGFCDEHTHNKLAPNRQNKFCNHRSVWEVIKSSPDYLQVSKPANEAPAVEYKIKKHLDGATRKPILYILHDRGYITRESEEFKSLSKINIVIHKFVTDLKDLDDGINGDVIVATGIYPSSNGGLLESTAGWGKIGNPDHFDKVITHIGEKPVGGTVDRDFGGALLGVAHQIKALKPTDGASVLIIKTGSPGIDTFDGVALEEEVYATFRQNNIRLFALELSSPEAEQKNLNEVTEKLKPDPSEVTDYRYLYIKDSSSGDLENTVQNILENAVKFAPTFLKPLISNKRLADPNKEITYNVKSQADVTVNLIIPNTPGTRLIVEDKSGATDVVVATKEWNVAKRSHLAYRQNLKHETIKIKFQCAGSKVCQQPGTLYITEEYEAVENSPEAAKIEIGLSASILGDYIDFSKTKKEFELYSKVEFEGKPVTNAKIVATVTLAEDQSVELPGFQLVDDGLGSPDVTKGDGIYSGRYIPDRDGPVRISVEVNKASVAQVSDDISIRLIPRDQDFDYECKDCSHELKDNVDLSADYPVVHFKNHAEIPGIGKPERVIDLRVTPDKDKGLLFRFTSPKIRSPNPELELSSYAMFGGQSLDDFFGDNPEAEVVWSTKEVKEPGKLVEGKLEEVTHRYFAVKTYGVKTEDESDFSYIQEREVYNPKDPVTDPPTSTPESENTGSTGQTSPQESTENDTTEKEKDEDKPFVKTAGGIVLIVFAVLLAVCIIGAVVWFVRKRNKGKGRFGV